MRSSSLVLSLAKVVVLVGCGLFLTAGPVLSQPRDGSGACRGLSGRRAGSVPGGLVGVMASVGRLNLSQDQQDRVRGIKEDKEVTLRTAEALVYSLRRTLHEATVAEVLNEQKIRSVAAELGLAEGDLSVGRARMRSQLWQLLTPDQQESAKQAEVRFRECVEQRRQQVDGRRGRGRRR